LKRVGGNQKLNGGMARIFRRYPASWPGAPPAIPPGNLAFPYPRHLKSSSPQMSMPDNETIAGIFPGEVIIVESGKKASPSQFATSISGFYREYKGRAIADPASNGCCEDWLINPSSTSSSPPDPGGRSSAALGCRAGGRTAPPGWRTPPLPPIS